MVTLAPKDPLKSVAFSLRAQAEGDGGRLGGRPPDGIVPAQPRTNTVYLATVRISRFPDLEASIFLTEREENELLKTGGRLYQGRDLGPIQVTLHGPTSRGTGIGLRSTLSERAIVLGDEQDDWYTGGQAGVVQGRHKIGGRPAIFKEWDLEERAGELLSNGYMQVLQLDFPGDGDDVVGGDWPFGDGMFHLLGREPFGEADWACFWEN